jgi:hypothetical protein
MVVTLRLDPIAWVTIAGIVCILACCGGPEGKAAPSSTWEVFIIEDLFRKPPGSEESTVPAAFASREAIVYHVRRVFGLAEDEVRVAGTWEGVETRDVPAVTDNAIAVRASADIRERVRLFLDLCRHLSSGGSVK